ncbi:MAG: acylphosphatase [Bacteroidales bacterium]|nr:acylphosphatase [Bacteroidales bacterium]
MVHYKISVKGKVQGVGFRYHTIMKAGELGVFGFVRNESDGSVYIEAEGDEDSVRKFLEWCHEGPRWARVTNVEVNSSEPQGYSLFERK